MCIITLADVLHQCNHHDTMMAGTTCCYHSQSTDVFLLSYCQSISTTKRSFPERRPTTCKDCRMREAREQQSQYTEINYCPRTIKNHFYTFCGHVEQVYTDFGDCIHAPACPGPAKVEDCESTPALCSQCAKMCESIGCELEPKDRMTSLDAEMDVPGESQATGVPRGPNPGQTCVVFAPGVVEPHLVELEAGALPYDESDGPDNSSDDGDCLFEVLENTRAQVFGAFPEHDDEDGLMSLSDYYLDGFAVFIHLKWSDKHQFGVQLVEDQGTQEPGSDDESDEEENVAYLTDEEEYDSDDLHEWQEWADLHAFDDSDDSDTDTNLGVVNLIDLNCKSVSRLPRWIFNAVILGLMDSDNWLSELEQMAESEGRGLDLDAMLSMLESFGKALRAAKEKAQHMIGVNAQLSWRELPIFEECIAELRHFVVNLKEQREQRKHDEDEEKREQRSSRMAMCRII